MKLELPSQLENFGITAFSVTGQGTPIVLIHGVGMRQQVWAPQVRDLGRDFKVITYDMLGHGQSDVPPEGVQLTCYAEQLLALLDHLGIQRAHVIGHSMGALIALEFALNYPQRCLRVAALNAVFCRTPEQSEAVIQRASSLVTSGILAGLDATLARWFDPACEDTHQQISAQIRDFLCQVDPVGYRRTYELFASSDRMHLTRLKSMEVPVLFMTGQNDVNSQPSMSRAMADLVPVASLEILADARHMMTLTHAADINQRLHSFLSGPDIT